MEISHTSVLLDECLQMLSPVGEPYENTAFMIDSTLGEGGHSLAFLQAFPLLHIMGLDADEFIQARAKERLAVFGDRMRFHLGWFDSFYANYPDELPAPQLILFDLGISLFHYEKSGRGFSFKSEEPLDMRLNPQSAQSAADIVNTYTQTDLADVLYLFGEERYSRRIARAFVEQRSQSRFETARQLADCVYHAVPSEYRHGRIHPATKTFQALRIAVNHEFDRLQRALEASFKVLEPGGKLGVITFHSLEDRIVKVFFRDLAKKCTCPPEQPICVCGGKRRAELLTRKPIVPTREETDKNAPSRSARLRVVRKIAPGEIVDD